MNISWIKIYQSIQGHWIWENPLFLKWWLDIIFMAEWRTCQRIVCGKVVRLGRGQFTASASFLMQRWRYKEPVKGRVVTPSKPTVLGFLKKLENEGMIKRDNTSLPNRETLITICNYKSYQGEVNTLKTTRNTTLQKGKTTHDTTTKTTSKTQSKNIYNNSSLRSEFSSSKLDCVDKAHDVNFWIMQFNRIIDEASSIIPHIRSISGNRLRSVMARAREFGDDAILTVARKAAASHYLNGKNKNTFVASFSWLMQPDNFQNVLEGNYDNHTGNKSAPAAHPLLGMVLTDDSADKFKNDGSSWNR